MGNIGKKLSHQGVSKKLEILGSQNVWEFYGMYFLFRGLTATVN